MEQTAYIQIKVECNSSGLPTVHTEVTGSSFNLLFGLATEVNALLEDSNYSMLDFIVLCAQERESRVSVEEKF